MGSFTFIPVWVIQDIIVFIAAVLVGLYIVKKESKPGPVLLEFFCFIFLYAAVYENLATLIGLYGYGKSLVMIFNVPLSVPVFEYLIVYSSLKLFETMRIPAWCKPLLVGLFGMLADFSLDPVAVKQVFSTIEATIGRWSWFPGPSAVQIYGEPVYNFTGWMLLCGYAAALLMLGRWWYKKSGYKPLVGYLYPVLTMAAGLLVMVSPLSQILLWLYPLSGKGGITEWIMLGVFLLLPAVLLAVFWRGRMKGRLYLKADFPVFIPLIGFHAVNVVFCLIGGYWQVLWLILLAFAVHSAIVMLIYFKGKRALSNSISEQSSSSLTNNPLR